MDDTSRVAGPASHPLDAAHREYLLSQGISARLIDASWMVGRLHTFVSRADIPPELRWAVDPVNPRALGFVWVAPGEDPVLQLRPEQRALLPDPDDPDGPPREAPKYVFPRGSSAHANLVSDPARVDDGTPYALILVEGTKQCLAVASALLDHPAYVVVGMPGCRGAFAGGGALHRSILRLARNASEIVVALDGDARTNPDVYDAGLMLRDKLWRKRAAGRPGRPVRFVRVPATAGGSGIDDVLAATAEDSRTGYMLDVIDAAEDTPADARPRRRRDDGLDDVYGPNGEFRVDAAVAALRARHHFAIDRHSNRFAVYDGQRVYVADPGTDPVCVAYAMSDLLGDRYTEGRLPSVARVLRKQLHREGLHVELWTDEPLLHVRNGWLDLRDGRLYPHTHERRSTWMLDVAYDPAARCPQTDEFLAAATMLDDGRDQVAQFWDVASQMLDSTRTPVKSLYLYGDRRAGKGTASRLLANLVPQELRCEVDLHVLATDAFAAADLVGRRINVVGETDDKSHVPSVKIYKMGQSPVTWCKSSFDRVTLRVAV